MAEIRVNVNVDGASKLDDLKSKVNNVDNSTVNATKSVNNFADSFSSLQRVIGVLALGKVIKESVELADTYKLMTARMSLVTKSTAELAAVQSELSKMSNNSRSSLEATTGLYTKLAQASSNMGKSQKDVLQVTESVGKALKISGAGAAESSSAMLQLGQALASGVLRGDELNSIMENAPRLAKAVADGMDVDIGKLRTMGAEGQLTADKVFSAIQKSSTLLNDEFSKIPVTVADGFTKLKNTALQMAGEIDKSLSGTGGIASSLDDFNTELGNSQSAIETVASAFGDLGSTVIEAFTDAYKTVGEFLNWIVDSTGVSSNGMEANFTFFDYFALGLKTAMAGLGMLYDGLLKVINYSKQAWAYVRGNDADYKAAQKANLELDKKSEERLWGVVDAYDNIVKSKKKAVELPAFDLSGVGTTKVGGAVESEKDKAKRIKAQEAADKKAHDARVKAMADINKATANQQKFDEDQLKLIEDKAKLEYQADQDRINAIKTYNDGLVSAQIEAYTAMGDTTSAYYLQEEQKMTKLAETGWYTNEQMLAIKTADNKKFQDDQWAKDNKYWADLFSNINKAMDEQFFNAMTGKFTSFGSWLKDFWSSISNSMAKGLSKSLADAILGTGSSGGGIQNIFKSFGGFLTGSAGGATALSASDSMGMTTTSGGTVIDAAGQIVTAGSDGLGGVGDIVNIASNIKSAYNLLSGGLSASVANGFAQGAAYTYNGLTAMGMSSGTAGSIAGGIGNFGAGMAAPWSTGAGSGLAAQSGAMLGGAAIGGVGGYALGSIGDKIFGADTKAANYGAIGGAIGSVAGPLGAVAGAVIGSLIGGMFGSTKMKGSGYSFSGTTTGENVSDTAQTYADYKKKSWFSSSSWTTYSAISSVEMKEIEGIFNTYDFLLEQLGSVNKVAIKAGKYAGQSFQTAIAKSFITAFTGVQETIRAGFFWGTKENPAFKEIYSYWEDYAKAVNKTVAEALTTSVGEYITTTRAFGEWKLGSGTVEQLKFTADYLAKDFSLLSESMGVSGVTVENYLARYEEAIKSSFTPETISTWKNLGDSLMTSTNATKALSDAQKKLADEQDRLMAQSIKPADMMLPKTMDLTGLYSAIKDELGTTKAINVEMLKVLKQQLNITTFGVPVV